MKKIAVLSILFSMALLALTLLTLTSWHSVRANNVPTVASVAPAVSIESLPLDVPEQFIQPLEDCEDTHLQEQLEKIVQSDKHWAELSRSKKLSIGIVDMEDPFHSRFAAINANNMVYAASLPKIAVLLASVDAIDKGALKETNAVKQDMRLMIAKSNNAATSRMIERVGINHIANVLQDPCYDLYDEKSGGGLWVGKLYGKGGKRVGDPMKNLSHAATVAQVCKYYYMLAFGQLVNLERSRQMLNILADPELHHKFVNVLDRVAPGAKVFRKSGTWKNWHADSAMVWDKTRRYIVVVLAEDAGGEMILRNLMQKIDHTLVPKA